MITKTGISEEFNLLGINELRVKTSSHKMAKYRKSKPYKLSFPKAILWFSILVIALGFLFMWYKLIQKLVSMFIE